MLTLLSNPACLGSGWGALAIFAVQTTGCSVDTITLSVHQQTAVTERVKAAGLSEKIRVHLMDYRDCKLRPEWENAFDRFMSVETMEHVGKEFLATFWGRSRLGSEEDRCCWMRTGYNPAGSE
jgi:cyclopropane-fatty-acyl-phospholipid synthase